MSLVSNALKKVQRISNKTAKVLIEEVIMPWYRSNGGNEAKRLSFDMREQVAARIHESLALLTWRVKDNHLPSFARDEYVVHNVEPLHLEDGNYTFVVKVRPVRKGLSEMELPLHAFLQAFESSGEIELHEYDS